MTKGRKLLTAVVDRMIAKGAEVIAEKSAACICKHRVAGGCDNRCAVDAAEIMRKCEAARAAREATRDPITGWLP